MKKKKTKTKKKKNKSTAHRNDIIHVANTVMTHLLCHKEVMMFAVINLSFETEYHFFNIINFLKLQNKIFITFQSLLSMSPVSVA